MLMDPLRQATRRWTRCNLGFVAAASLTGLTAAILFVGFPAIDFAVVDLFHVGKQAFLFNYEGPGKDLRTVFNVIFWIAVAVSIAGLITAAFFRRNLLTLDFPSWLFIVLSLAVAAGFVANAVLKDNWGRARPFHVKEYGGEQTFTPVLMWSDQCRENCSFVSGEAAAMYTLFFALALLAKRRRTRLILLGVGAGTLAGLVRIAQGGHFPSDVVFAGVFMALMVRLLYWLVFELGGDTFEHDGPVHARLLVSGRRFGAMIARWVDAVEGYGRNRVTRLGRWFGGLRLPPSLQWLTLPRRAPAATGSGAVAREDVPAGP